MRINDACWRELNLPVNKNYLKLLWKTNVLNSRIYYLIYYSVGTQIHAYKKYEKNNVHTCAHTFTSMVKLSKLTYRRGNNYGMITLEIANPVGFH